MRQNMGNINLRHPNCIVGTPGRVYDMIDRCKLNLNEIKLLCLDEIDVMLSRGFEKQVTYF